MLRTLPMVLVLAVVGARRSVAVWSLGLLYAAVALQSACGLVGYDAVVTDDGGQGQGGDAADPTLAEDCAPLPAPTGSVETFGPGDVAALRTVLAEAPAGTTILLDDGTYDMSEGSLVISAAGITLRSASDDPTRVTMTGNSSGATLVVAASNVTVASIGFADSADDGVDVVAGMAGATSGVRLFDVRVVDPKNAGIRITSKNGALADDGVLSCSELRITKPSCTSNLGIRIFGGRGWQVVRNTIAGFDCVSDARGILASAGTRDTRVANNRIEDTSIGISIGLDSSGVAGARTYSDQPCGSGYFGSIGGVVCNNVIVARGTSVDSGIGLWATCNASVVNNSVAFVDGADPVTGAIEWRYPQTTGLLVDNNLGTHVFLPRDGAETEPDSDFRGNLPSAPPSVFIDASGGDLHLSGGVANPAIGAGVAPPPGLCDSDIDGDPRVAPYDVGADEVP